MWKSLLYQLWEHFQKSPFFPLLRPSHNLHQGGRNYWIWRTVEWAGFRVDIDLQLRHFAAQTQTLWAFINISRLFSIVFYPRKKKTTLDLSSVKSHFFSSLCRSQTEPRHASPMKRKSAISKLHATSRQIKALITATIFKGWRVVAYIGYKTSSSCFDSMFLWTTKYPRCPLRCFGPVRV